MRTDECAETAQIQPNEFHESIGEYSVDGQANEQEGDGLGETLDASFQPPLPVTPDFVVHVRIHTTPLLREKMVIFNIAYFAIFVNSHQTTPH